MVATRGEASRTKEQLIFCPNIRYEGRNICRLKFRRIFDNQRHNAQSVARDAVCLFSTACMPS
jgi:hypothetical protein